MAVSIVIAVTENSQNIANNTTNVTVKVNAKWTGGSYNLLEKSGYLIIDGTKYTFTSPFNTGQTTSGSCNLYTKTVNVTHNEGGTKILSCSASYTSGVSSGTVAASCSVALTTIPRKSTLSVSAGTLGTSQTLTITRKSTDFTHSIKAVCGSSTLYIKADGSTSSSEVKHTDCSIPFTPPLSWANQNTTGTTVSVKYTITTYSSTKQIGTASYTVNCSIPASVKPSCSISVTDPTGYKDTFGAFIKGYSKFAVEVTATTSYGSAIASYKVNANGSDYAAASFTTNVLKSSGTLAVTATVKDKRGRSGSATVNNLTVLDYAKPKISSLTVQRCNADGTANNNGAYIKASCKVTMYKLQASNTVHWNLEFKKTSEATSAYIAPDYEFSGRVTEETDTITTSELQFIFAASSSISYDVRFTATDSVDSVQRVTTMSTGFKFISQKAGGTGIAFGKVAEVEDAADFAFKILSRKNAVLVNDKSFCGTDTDGTEYSALIPITASGNTSLGHGLYKAGKGNTHIYGNKVQFYTNEGIYTNGNDVYMDNNRYIFGITTAGAFKQAFQAQNSNNNTILGYGNYDEQSGGTHIYGHDLLFGVSNIASPGTFRPYMRQGMSATMTIRTAGYVTNAKTEVHFTVPLSRPVIGSPTVTVTSGYGFILRQTNYTHGCNATTYIKPTKYTATLDMDYGLAICATFSDTTNAVNNAPVGIAWNGTITFT